ITKTENGSLAMPRMLDLLEIISSFALIDVHMNVLRVGPFLAKEQRIRGFRDRRGFHAMGPAMLLKSSVILWAKYFLKIIVEPVDQVAQVGIQIRPSRQTKSVTRAGNDLPVHIIGFELIGP